MPDLILNVSSTVSTVYFKHPVKAGQEEPCPDGSDTCLQASEHELDLLLLNINLGASYYFNDWLGVRFNLPLRIVNLDATFRDDVGNIMEDFVSNHHRDETLVGPGDVNLTMTTRHAGQFNSSLSWFFGTSLGTTLPTGSMIDNPEVLGGPWRLSHQHIFFGRGMPAPMVGINGSLRSGWGFFEAGVNATIPFLKTPSKRYVPTPGQSEYDTQHDWDVYELGHYLAPKSITTNLGLGSNFGTDDWSFTATTQVQHEEQAKWQGFPQANTGKTEILVGARSSFAINPSMMVELNIRVPVYLHTPTASEQIEMPFLLGFGFYYTLDL